MASEETPTGLLGAVSSAAQQATSVVSSALEAMHITASHDQDAEAQGESKKENGDAAEKENGTGKEQDSQQEDKDAAELEEGEIREANGQEEKQGPRTVFDDPASFNLKVRRSRPSLGPNPDCSHLPFSSNFQHPLYTPWTLHYGSPAVKNLPKTPAPASAHGGAAEKASGWMEEIRKVTTFDSVEEFWG